MMISGHRPIGNNLSSIEHHRINLTTNTSNNEQSIATGIVSDSSSTSSRGGNGISNDHIKGSDDDNNNNININSNHINMESNNTYSRVGGNVMNRTNDRFSSLLSKSLGNYTTLSMSSMFPKEQIEPYKEVPWRR
jgi:hypothetical protein